MPSYSPLTGSRSLPMTAVGSVAAGDPLELAGPLEVRPHAAAAPPMCGHRRA